MPVVHQREAAGRDLVEHFVYLMENAGQDVADRPLSNAEATFGDLAQQPRTSFYKFSLVLEDGIGRGRIGRIISTLEKTCP